MSGSNYSKLHISNKSKLTDFSKINPGINYMLLSLSKCGLHKFTRCLKLSMGYTKKEFILQC